MQRSCLQCNRSVSFVLMSPLWCKLQVKAWLKSVAVAVFICAYAGGLALASADTDGVIAQSAVETVSAAAPAAPVIFSPIVLLGVYIDGKPDRVLRDAVSDRLTRLGEEVKNAQESAELSVCKQTGCYAEMSTRNSVLRVLRLDIYESAARRYYIEGALYDRATNAVRTSSGSCEDCSSENLRATLADLAGRLVNPAPAVKATPKAQPSSKSAPEAKLQEAVATAIAPPVAAPPRAASRWTRGRIALVTLTSVLTAASLVSTIALGASAQGSGANQQLCTLDQNDPLSSAPPCISRTAVIVTGSIFTGLSATGLAVSLLYPLFAKENSL